MISQTVEYALRAVVTIAQNAGQPCTARTISEVTQVPTAYLSKLMQRLARNGIVNSKRGMHGGFVLAKRPEQLTVWDIVEAVEPIKRIRNSASGIPSQESNLCPLYQCLNTALDAIERIFRESTVAELLSRPNDVKPTSAV